MVFLEQLRQAARLARNGRNLTLSDSRRLLSCPGAASGALELVVRVMGEVLGRRPVFHGPGAAMASFDEAWLVRLHTALMERDVDSVALLVGRRVPRALRRSFLDLLRAVDPHGTSVPDEAG
ncbi:MAG: hypothetical protein AAFU80_04600 [Pseudomonadota bacterium]